jgi:hypothetical protein
MTRASQKRSYNRKNHLGNSPYESPLPSEENLCGRISGEHGTCGGCVSCRECVSWFQALDLDTAEFFLQGLHFHVVILRGGEVCDG